MTRQWMIEDGLTPEQADDLIARGWTWWTYLEVRISRKGGYWL